MADLHPDLFEDDPTPIPVPKSESLRDQIGYRKAKDGEPACKDCPNLIKQRYNGKNYYKCAQMGVSRSQSTDIRLSGTCKYHPEKVKKIWKK